MKFDIIIVGGGMVGGALASALSQTDLRVALIDARTLDEDHHDPRLIALNDSSCEFFKALNLWKSLEPFAAPIHEVHVSYKKKFGITRITREELHLESLGAVVPAKYLNAALNQSLSNVEIIRPASLKNFTQHESGVSVETESQTFNTRILVGADGTDSTVRKLLNANTQVTDHQQSAIVTITDLKRDHKNIAYERFHSSGAIAMLPLNIANQHQAATIWSDSHANISQLLDLSDEDFLKKLQAQFGYRLGRFQKINKRAVYPLKTVLTSQQVYQHVLLIGNAAHTLHPIAAQGLNLALHEVQTIASNLSRDPNLCAADLLPSSLQQTASIRLSHHLPKLFTHDFFMLATARQLGLIGLDLFSRAKTRFAKNALGKT